MSKNEAYDPTAPEGDVRRSDFMTLKDAKIIVLGLIGLFGILTPVYFIGKKNADKTICVANMKAISYALGVYQEDKDGRLPPVFREGSAGEPNLAGGKYPFTWISDIAPAMSKRASFKCPSADPSEIAYNEDPTNAKKTIPSTYGLYLPLGTASTMLVANPEQTILITETSNSGAMNSYNPQPYKDENGQTMLYDGFAIGWGNSNFDPPTTTSFVTRLAFRDTKDGNFSEKSGRHDAINHAINISGRKINIKSGNAGITIVEGIPSGTWAVPPRSLSGR